MAVRYNADEPTIIQSSDWSCAPTSTRWALKALGRTPSEEWIESAMIADAVVSQAQGLLDASGKRLAEWITASYGEYGFSASNAASVSFDDVRSVAGSAPVLIGGRRWGAEGHWCGVRRYDPATESLVLANPGGTGPIYGQQTLDRQAFDARGPFSLVTVTHPDLTATAPAPTATLRGIDVASHQGAVNWPAVAASGVAFALTKATGGVSYRNPTFAANWRGMKAAGMVRGAYHYAFESTIDPLPSPATLMVRADTEADAFCNALEALGTEAGDLLCLDIEDGDHVPLGDWCLRWLQRVEGRTGIKAFCYTGKWFSDPHGFGLSPGLAAYPLWLADYGSTNPSAPAPWREVKIHQYSANGAVPGIVGNVDMNNFFGDRAALLALGKPGIVTSPVPVYGVGPGLLAMMTVDGTTPISPSTFLPLGQSPAFIEEGYGANGVIYRWFLATGQSFRYRPAT